MTKKPASSQDQAIAKYLPYLKEAQQKLIHVAIVFAIASLVGFTYYQPIIRFIMQLFQLDGINIVLTSPYQFINLAVKCGLLTGISFSLPLLGFYLIRFVKPALKKKEYKLLMTLYPISLVLFIAGFFFGTWTIQMIIRIYTQVSNEFNVENLWDLGNFLGQILSTGILMSLVFQLPIILTGLIRLKITTLNALRKSRRYIYTVILIGVALLPPNDIVSLIALTIPPLLLFEITLLFNRDYA